MTQTPPTEVRGEKPRKAPQTGAADRIGEDRIRAYHEYTRDKGVNFLLYSFARALLLPFFLVWFRLDRIGREHAKTDRGLIVASNHRSFLDPFVIGALLPWRRPIHYVAKVELFENRFQAWLLSRLGAYPVRRGQADEETVATSAAIIERGGAVCRHDAVRGFMNAAVATGDNYFIDSRIDRLANAGFQITDGTAASHLDRQLTGSKNRFDAPQPATGAAAAGRRVDEQMQGIAGHEPTAAVE